MSDRTPPLTALRAFEAAARHLSFAVAADELGVTPAALSFQIKSLEERLGAPLFHRMNRAVRLTEVGRALAPEISRGFEVLNSAWRAARSSLDTNRLTVSAGPAFTGKWLAPRLGDFARAHPEIELRLAATFAFVDFARDDVDLAVRFGRPRQDGHFSELLSREWTTPMARPDVAAKLQRPADLLEHTLIYDEGFTEIEPSATWETWFAQFDIDLAAAPRRLAVNQSDHALDYVIQNGGVALGRYTIAMESLRSGALAAPFDVALPSEAQFRIVCPRGRQELPAIAAFRNWLKGHVERDQAMVGAHGVQLRET